MSSRFVLLSSVVILSLFSNPQGGVVISGEAAFEGTGSLSIQVSDRAILHWDSFSIGPSEKVAFLQPGKDSAVLNQVVGAEPSHILGSLQAEGRVYLINPQGILFGKEALLDVGSLVASALQISGDPFADGELLFSGTGSIVNEGRLVAREGDLVLLAHRVENLGALEAPQGNAWLGAGQEILVGVEGKSFLYVRPTVLGEGLENVGEIQALKTVLESKVSPYFFGIQQGKDALHLERKDGEVFLRFTDPYPEEEPMLWRALQAEKETSFARYEGADDREIEPLDLRQEAPWRLAFCPPQAVDLIDPNASGAGSSFGDTILALSTGNVVVTKTGDDFTATNAGAVYLYNGATGALISALRGGAAECSIGSGGVTALTGNGNYVILSPSWDDGITANLGAATWGSGTTGVSGIVSSSNSLIGSSSNDQVSYRDAGNGILPLTNGNYVVISQYWGSLGFADDAKGAATFGNGFTGTSGVVSASNSLVGTQTGDRVGYGYATVLENSNYVVLSKYWINGGFTSAGAATFGSGSSGVSGAVSTSNSLVGGTTSAFVGESATALSNGNYVVDSSVWTDGVTAELGAATWCDGTTGLVATVSGSNSLIGTRPMDKVGNIGVFALTNGNYVVSSNLWNNGGETTAGAVTWCDGTTGKTGVVTTSNSLVGTLTNDAVGNSIQALPNGNYVVVSNREHFGVASGGSATWVNGATGLPVGPVTTLNSLHGTESSDFASSSIVVLTGNSNYLVVNTEWHGGSTNLGAVTWCSGTEPTVGAISSSNSLVGSAAWDRIASPGAYALTNGNYVVLSTNWDSGGFGDTGKGAATWGSGTSGITGFVSSANSIVGTQVGDLVGEGLAAALPNGNYVIASTSWANGDATTAGAVTWCNGNGGTVGAVSPSNSLVGTQAGDQVGLIPGGFPTPSAIGMKMLTNGHYAVRSGGWANGAVSAAGAITWGNGDGGTVGPVSIYNSLVGTSANDGIGGGSVLNLSFDEFAIVSPNWDNGSLTNAGAITIANASNGTFCNGTYGAISPENSFVGLNASTGLADVPLRNAVNGRFYVQFTDYLGETSVFSLPLTQTQVRSYGLHDFAIAISEALNNWDWLSLKSHLDASSIYPPYGTYKKLALQLPSLTQTEKP